ncbi:hypothetical protein B0H13DRAFT_1895769 [Mycena leptocephala]|nr:hypothetical protein B0H13DRAFT_1895769 [Mycena leptocephala]
MASVFKFSATIPPPSRYQSLPARTGTPPLSHPFSEDESLGYPEPDEMEGSDRTSTEHIGESMHYTNSSFNTVFASSRAVSPTDNYLPSGHVIYNPDVHVVPGLPSVALPMVLLEPIFIVLLTPLMARNLKQPFVLDSPDSSPEPEQSQAKRHRLDSLAPTEPSLPTPQSSPPPAVLAAWLIQDLAYPLYSRQTQWFTAAKQSAHSILDLGKMYTLNFASEPREFGAEPRLLNRNFYQQSPRYRNVSQLAEVEVYFNQERSAHFPLEILELIRLQTHEERRGNQFLNPPGFTLISNHLRVAILPQEFADLHNNAASLTPAHWESTHRIFYEIISLKRDTPTISSIIHGRLRTPLPFQCIPFSTKYHFGHGDPLTLFFSAIRCEIEKFLGLLLRLHKKPGPGQQAFHPAVLEYEQAVQERKIYAQAMAVPISFLTNPVTTPPRTHPSDILPFGAIPEHHPFLHTYERDFLVHCNRYFKTAYGPVKHLPCLIRKVVSVRFVQQLQVSQLFQSGVLFNAGAYELYDGVYEGDDMNQTNHFDESELDRSPLSDDHQLYTDDSDNDYDPADYLNGWE